MCFSQMEEFMSKKKEITISQKEYDRLTKADWFLDCLEACGVDNWCGYGDAVEMMNSEEDNE